MEHDFKVEELPPQPALAIRETAAVAEIPAKMGECFAALGRFFGERRIPFAGPPFAYYHSWSDAATVMDVGFPVPPGTVGRRADPGHHPPRRPDRHGNAHRPVRQDRRNIQRHGRLDEIERPDARRAHVGNVPDRSGGGAQPGQVGHPAVLAGRLTFLRGDPPRFIS